MHQTRTLEELLLAAQQGDKAALSQLIEQLTPWLTSKARLQRGPQIEDYESTVDSVQSAFLAAIKHDAIQTAEGVGALRGRLVRTLETTILDTLRGMQRQRRDRRRLRPLQPDPNHEDTPNLEPPAPPAPSPASTTASQEELAAILAYLDQLPSFERRLIEASMLDTAERQTLYEGLASERGESINAIRKRVARLLKRMRDDLNPGSAEAGAGG